MHVLPRRREVPAGEHGLDLSEFGSSRFSNRELSWLDFGERLLELAEDASLPVLERVKFIAIFSEGPRRVLPGAGRRPEGPGGRGSEKPLG